MIDLVEILTMKNVLRLLMIVILFGYCVFAFVLMLRVRILSQTLVTQKSTFVSFLARIHAIVVIVGSAIVGILILL